MTKGPPQAHGERVPNLAPMVDIIMCLLIYFMLSGALYLNREGVLQTELDPRSGPAAGEKVQVNPVVKIGLEDVNDGKACNIWVLDEMLGENKFDELRSYMAQRRAAGADPGNPVIIGAIGSVRYRFVISAFDACVRAGFKNVQFAVSFAESESAGG